MNNYCDRNKDQVLWKHMEGTRDDKKCYHHREDFAKEPLPKEKVELGQAVQEAGTFWVEERDVQRTGT